MVADDFEPLQCHILFRGINTCFLFCNADLLIDRKQEPAPGTFADNDPVAVHIQLLRSFDVLRLSKDIDRQFKIRELALCYRRKARIFRAGADRVLNDLFGDVFPRRENRSDTAAQFAVFMNKYTGAFREKRVRNGMFYRSANGRVP